MQNQIIRGMQKLSYLMNERNSFLLLHDFKASFAKQYQLDAIPRYMLISSEGNIINFNAPRPSEAKLVQVIDSYLNK